MIKNPPTGYKITTPYNIEQSPLTKFTFQVDSNLYKRFLYQFGASTIEGVIVQIISSL